MFVNTPFFHCSPTKTNFRRFTHIYLYIFLLFFIYYLEPYNRLVKIKRNCKNGIKGIKETLCLKSDKSPKDSNYTRAYLTLEEKVSEIQHEDSPVKDILLQIACIHRSFAIEQANFERRVADTLDNGHIRDNLIFFIQIFKFITFLCNQERNLWTTPPLVEILYHPFKVKVS